jgi:pimeloyl-ACP methyl ester carboxylesterase
VPFLSAAGQRLEYRLIAATRPQAPPFVLLHEGLGSLAMWRDFPDRLAALSGAAVLAYSRPGYGRSAPLPGPRRADYMHREALETLPRVLAQLAIAEPVLVGHSDGASIALIYAGAAPAAVRALVLMAPHVFVEERTIAGARAARAAWQAGDLKARLARYHDDAEAAFRGWNEIWLAPEFRSWNIAGFLPAIACPLLLIQGEDDAYGTLAQLGAIRRGVASRRIAELVLPGCGHAPHRERPQAVLAAIARFVAGLQPAGGSQPG